MSIPCSVSIAELEEGDVVTSAPLCCGDGMTATEGPTDTVWDCQYGDSQVITNQDGLVTESPLIHCN